ncbi:MAG TPA: hypothetical protein VMH87_17475 [Pseudomonadales bacterium]|nr:hypothetical protein [Pseudomonadales bacterium]
MTYQWSYSSPAASALDCGGCDAAFWCADSLVEEYSSCAGFTSVPMQYNPQPKSTVDLGLEPLIWGENTLLKRLFPGSQHSFHTITTRQWSHANQNQTNTNRKINKPLPFIKDENPLREPENFKPIQTCLKLFKPIQDSPRGDPFVTKLIFASLPLCEKIEL